MQTDTLFMRFVHGILSKRYTICLVALCKINIRCSKWKFLLSSTVDMWVEQICVEVGDVYAKIEKSGESMD